MKARRRVSRCNLNNNGDGVLQRVSPLITDIRGVRVLLKAQETDNDRLVALENSWNDFGKSQWARRLGQNGDDFSLSIRLERV